jgi:3-hydroxyacyl-[acyl-carrier-protein] dehydratase
MPSMPLIDLETIDLTKIHATKAEVYRVLKHAGRFALLDGVLRFEQERKLSVGYKEIRRDDWWAADHIPGRPIFPGVLMIETAAQLGSWDYLVRHPDDKGFIGFGGVNETRFRGIVEPDTRMVFVAEERRVRRGMFVYGVQGFLGQNLVFETEVLGLAM